MFPKASNIAFTSTPSFAFCANSSNRALVSEVEIFQIDILLGVSYLFEQTDKLLTSAGYQLQSVIVGYGYILLLQIPCENGIGRHPLLSAVLLLCLHNSFSLKAKGEK